MNPTAQRAAIAEACGWTNVHWWEDMNSNSGLCGYVGTTPNKQFNNVEIPNYLNDLNAMRGAAQTLTDTQKIDYHIHLYVVLSLGGFPMYGEHGHLTPMGCFIMIDATAAQRAEAFLRTLNLWKE